jgi:NAD(P)-dependent dehydrogenase (short-subunit alcohol dehydrogenase family)
MRDMKTAVFAGIGRLGVPVVENLVRQGWQAVISYRPGHTSQETVEKLIENTGPERVKGVAAEIVELSAAQAFVKASIDAFGRIDALINIASGYPTEKDDWQRWQRGGEVTDEDWKYYDSNFTLIRNVILSALKEVKDPSGLNIINFGDARSMQFFDDGVLDPYEREGGILCVNMQQVKQGGLEGLATVAPKRHVNPYTLAKVDIAYLTRKLSIELGAKGVRVNAIAPGPIIPPPDSEGKAVDSIAAQTCLGKWGGLEPVVKAVDYLLADDFVTGEILKVDGGLFLKQRFGGS